MDEVDLVKKSMKGDKEAFSILIKNYEKSFYRIAISIVKNNEDALDCIQDTILKAYENIVFIKKPKYFKTWVIRILINNCNDLLVKRSKRVNLENFNESSQGYDFTTSVEINDILIDLEEELKTIVILYYFEDLKVKDIAKMIGIPQGTVKSRLSRARGRLKVLIESSGKEVELI